MVTWADSTACTTGPQLLYQAIGAGNLRPVRAGHERSWSATACRSALPGPARRREIGSPSDVTIGIIELMGIVTGPIRWGDGIAPAVALVDPKFPHNVGAAVRAATCYGVRQVWFSGDRVRLDGAERQRSPREERMRGYKEVEVRHADQFFDAFEEAVPVAVELRRNAESLIDFVHPEHALYVFGPEDGSLGRATLRS